MKPFPIEHPELKDIAMELLKEAWGLTPADRADLIISLAWALAELREFDGGTVND